MSATVADTLAEFAGALAELQSNFGQSVTLNQKSGFAYNGTTGATTATIVSTVLNAIIGPLVDEQMPGGETRRHRNVTIPTAAVSAKQQDDFTINGQTWEIEEIDTPQPGVTQVCRCRLT